ncbi:DUF6083 domain-containing protein [Streptomyces acidiscabies]|uniref:DUF6083 domain-containing protein n=1 Tax=Streptomyces acidiscabies TaxID=42234 RepID=A0AAP6BAV8_9ACTN|nr:DUF6083 domain-containing protein [Streptomyces acidiscabies]MBP5935719.1 hypothetical protein [Streptomyces sp. LBUM 1476]MBZ3916387.1 hypothetical protein [Streptomyces acidiscabies]MDX2961240.1 DUF6083 domain-containing protein [Streptomyces acidiscabies]MDX3022806.1 DUF6083 domain-containing protein [Streptomyces acidiscabies]MDX3791947.1 DUF6083 domain-containing protein [Streptomyces acidiscabies]
MRPSPVPRRLDGSPVPAHPRRSLCVDPDSPSRLLRCAQRDRCSECGNQVEWYQRVRDRPVRLHPQELPTAAVPADHRWHVSSGLAYPSGDGSDWCRLTHARVCPVRIADIAAIPELTSLRRTLAVNTRRLVDAGSFTPAAAPTGPAARQPQDPCRPARPVVQILFVRYLAARPLEELQCVAQTRRRDQCTLKMLASDGPAGVWKLVPATATQGQLALPAEMMALYDLSSLTYAEQLRWRTQRCPQHAATPTAADLELTDWEPFDPLVHHTYVHRRLPTHSRRPKPGGGAQKAVR